ncbi:MAG: TAXI family TRAP transporter solute-binding subunit, partial [Methyloligellaceae bacterium]
MPLVSEMADVIGGSKDLRVLPVIGFGTIQNVRDLLQLKSIDIGLVHSDVFTYLQQRNLYPTAQEKLRYIVNLNDELFHIVAHANIRDVKQLAGRKVIVAKPGSGSEMSAHTLFTILGIKPVYV